MILANVLPLKKTNAQKSELSYKKKSKLDSIIVDFLLRQGQFYDIPLSDTLNPNRFAMVNGLFMCDKIIEIQNRNRTVIFYGFGTNYSHSRNYLLIKMSNSNKILGASSLEDDLPKLYNIFESLGSALNAKEMVTCYELLIRNYNLSYPPPVHLIKDPNYKK